MPQANIRSAPEICRTCGKPWSDASLLCSAWGHQRFVAAEMLARLRSERPIISCSDPISRSS